MVTPRLLATQAYRNSLRASSVTRHRVREWSPITERGGVGGAFNDSFVVQASISADNKQAGRRITGVCVCACTPPPSLFSFPLSVEGKNYAFLIPVLSLPLNSRISCSSLSNSFALISPPIKSPFAFHTHTYIYIHIYIHISGAKGGTQHR